MRDIRDGFGSVDEDKENKSSLFWKSRKSGSTSLQSMLPALRKFLYETKNPTNAEKLLEQGMPLITAITEVATCKTSAYQLLRTLAEKRCITPVVQPGAKRQNTITRNMIIH